VSPFYVVVITNRHLTSHLSLHLLFAFYIQDTYGEKKGTGVMGVSYSDTRKACMSVFGLYLIFLILLAHK